MYLNKKIHQKLNTSKSSSSGLRVMVHPPAGMEKEGVFLSSCGKAQVLSATSRRYLVSKSNDTSW
jgi:hypothetical protein